MGDLNIDGAIWGITAILLFIAATAAIGVIMLHGIKEQLEALAGKQDQGRVEIDGAAISTVFDQEAA